jgi:hypothetical protein
MLLLGNHTETRYYPQALSLQDQRRAEQDMAFPGAKLTLIAVEMKFTVLDEHIHTHQANNTNSHLFCSYCKKPNHTYKDCRKRKQDEQNKHERVAATNSHNNKPRKPWNLSNITCHNCGKKSHFTRDCPDKVK